VVPLLDTFEEIKEWMDATLVTLPTAFDYTNMMLTQWLLDPVSVTENVYVNSRLGTRIVNLMEEVVDSGYVSRRISAGSGSGRKG
jgi:hypothetical protein